MCWYLLIWRTSHEGPSTWALASDLEEPLGSLGWEPAAQQCPLVSEEAHGRETGAERPEILQKKSLPQEMADIRSGAPTRGRDRGNCQGPAWPWRYGAASYTSLVKVPPNEGSMVRSVWGTLPTVYPLRDF